MSVSFVALSPVTSVGMACVGMTWLGARHADSGSCRTHGVTERGHPHIPLYWPLYWHQTNKGDRDSSWNR
jgi:hypothetical protein